MSLTPSSMMPLGTVAPGFRLPDAVSGRTLALADVRGKRATVVMFICNHCPYVKHVRAGLAQFARDYASHGVGVVAISSNDAERYPEDGPEEMRLEARQQDYPFPYLFDESQDVARAYSAACTPDFFVFDANLECAYRGQFDGSRPGNGIPVSGADLRSALDALVAGRDVNPDQKPSVGCNIKWKS